MVTCLRVVLCPQHALVKGSCLQTGYDVILIMASHDYVHSYYAAVFHTIDVRKRAQLREIFTGWYNVNINDMYFVQRTAFNLQMIQWSC